MRSFLAIAVLIMTAAAAAGAEADCHADDKLADFKGAVQRASETTDPARFKAALDAATRESDECTRYQAYEWLGEFWAGSLNRSDWAHAVDAFVSAADTAADAPARARSLYNYARLLNRDGDPQNANTLVREAKAFDPGNADIAALAARIAQLVEHPTVQQLHRGLWDSLYKPINIAAADRLSQPAAAASQAPSASPVPTASAATPISQGSAVKSTGPSISIPINFTTGTVFVDEQTRSHVGVLATALAYPGFSNRQIGFIGHADVRGNEASNMALSKRRAEAIYQTVITLQPSLRGRIEVTGHGSSEPIDPGHDAAAYRANRRLQVILK